MPFEMIGRNAGVLAGLLAVCCGLGLPTLQAQEFRALWADTFHAGLRTTSEVSQLVADARAGNFNAVIVEVRKRGDAYYESSYEPKATDVSPPSFDPLADLIAKAHTGGPRIEVHAWITTYVIWGNRTNNPSNPSHPYNLHTNWLTKDNTGSAWDGSNYQFDPGHPEVQQYVFDVALDIISRYDVDGFHFDYVRYSGNTWGYHDVALNRFKARYNRTGTPASSDAQWMQFRRDQVSALVRKVYLSAIAVKPQVKMSAATITWAPGPTTDSDWYSSAAWSSVLQDWRGWMEEGILDLAIPMAYFNQSGTYGYSWTNWNNYAKNHRYNRHVAIGPGIYLNSLSNALFQLRYPRLPTAAGQRADGVSGYSYAVPTSDGTPRATFLAALTQTNVSHLYDPNPDPVFPSPTNPPAMLWKTAPTRGHLKGVVTALQNGAGVDGALVSLTGPAIRVQTNDGTGFYGFVDLPPGTYTVMASFSNLLSQSALAVISNGVVTTVNLALAPPATSVIANVQAHPGRVAAVVEWTTSLPADSQVEYGTVTNYGNLSPLDPAGATNHSVFLGGLLPGTNYFFRVHSRAGTNLFSSDAGTFATAGQIILDNPEAGFTGSWTLASSAPDRYASNYHYASSVSGSATATATYTPTIATPGNYDIYVWYCQGANRTTNAPVLISCASGSATVYVNQTAGGGGWQLLAAGQSFARGSGGFVRVANNGQDTGKVVIADGVRFVYAPNQDPPPDGAVPEWWSRVYFGSAVNGLLDHDGDGFSTAAEYVLGTRPNDPNSRLDFRSARSGNALQISFAPYTAGRIHRLRSRPDLVAGEWTVASNLTATLTPEGRGVFSITNPPGAQKFYRLQVQLAP